MEFYNRRLLLLNEDMPSSTISALPLLQDNKPSLPATLANSSSPPVASTKSSSASEYRTPLQMPPSPALDSNITSTMLVLLTALFFSGFISIYIRRFSDEHSGSSRRRPHRNRPSTPSSWNYYSSSPCHNHKGADHATVQSLPVYMYHGGLKHMIDCAICQSEFEEGEKVKMIPYCRHVFHVECIDMWLFSHVSCPICRCTKLFRRRRGVAMEEDQRWKMVEGWGARERWGHRVREVGRQKTSATSNTELLTTWDTCKYERVAPTLIAVIYILSYSSSK